MNQCCTMENHPIKLRKNLLLGIGNPLLDISANVNKELLDRFQMKEDDAIIANCSVHSGLNAELIQNFGAEFIAGGSVQNALRVAQWLVRRPEGVATFFGCVGSDQYSRILEEKARSNGVDVHYQYKLEGATGTCAVLITGRHRSLCANLAAANCFTIDHIRQAENLRLIQTADFFYISGFFLPVSFETVQEVAQHACENNKHFLMNLSAPFIAKTCKDQWQQILPYVDVLFGNETEAETFAATDTNVHQDNNTIDLKVLALKLSQIPKLNVKRQRICVITRGNNPILVATNGVCTEYPVNQLPDDDIVDTNGAGDAFVGGFLAQYIQGEPLESCIRCGIWAATQIVQRSGCTFDGEPEFR